MCPVCIFLFYLRKNGKKEKRNKKKKETQNLATRNKKAIFPKKELFWFNYHLSVLYIKKKKKSLQIEM